MNQQQKFLAAIILTFCGLLFFKSYVLAAIEPREVVITNIEQMDGTGVFVEGYATKTSRYPTLTFTLINPETDIEYPATVVGVVWDSGSQYNYWAATLDVDGIPTGAYNLRVRADFPDGAVATYLSVLDDGGRCNGGVCVP